MIAAFAGIFLCQLLGELFARAFNLPLPGPVLGMGLLFLYLLLRGGQTRRKGREPSRPGLARRRRRWPARPSVAAVRAGRRRRHALFRPAARQRRGDRRGRRPVHHFCNGRHGADLPLVLASSVSSPDRRT